jgi:RNA-directed DNA polymerase
MKRAANLFDAIADRDNLRLAFYKARRGKRDRGAVQQFAADLDRNLAQMAKELQSGSITVGAFQQFEIHDPKKRLITAPCFRERVLHHAIINVCEPHLERWLIADTFACRTGKGRTAALLRTQHFARRFPFFLKLDIRHYFDSISHGRLLERLGHIWKDQQLLALFERVVGAFRGTVGRGVPIGSLISQHLANFYLGWFDRFVKESLRMRGYVRYMDDMLIWSDSKVALRSTVAAGTAYLRDVLDLELKSWPYLNRTTHGMDFLGCRVFRWHTILNRRSRVRFRRKLGALQRRHDAGFISEAQLQQRGTALVAFTRTPGVRAWRFRARCIQT